MSLFGKYFIRSLGSRHAKSLWAAAGLFAFLAGQASHGASFHLTAASPWFAFADPLSRASGVPLLNSIFDSLTEIEPDGSVAPELALSWQIKSDKIWSFTLRHNVAFSDGQELDADAVVSCLEMLMGDKGKTYGTSIYMDGIVAVRAIDKYTVEIETDKNDARLARKLSNVPIFSVPAFERVGRVEFSKDPVGTGSYRIESWSKSNSSVVLQGVPRAWRAAEQVDRVEIVVVPDSSARLQSLLSGNTDFANALDPDAISVIEAAGHKVSVNPGPMVLALGLRTANDAVKPLRDVRVRRALNMAIDRTNISQNLLLGTMPPATQVATPDVLGYNPDIEPYRLDRAQARALLAEAGYPTGFSMVAGLMMGEVPGDRLIYQQMAQDLESIGVRVELRSIPTPDMMRRRASQSWEGIDAISTLWSNYRLGDISRSAEQFSCLDPTSSFCDPGMADMIAASHEEMDPDKRKALLQAITARFQELAPSILLVQFSSIDGISSRVEVIPHSTGNIKFAQMRVNE